MTEIKNDFIKKDISIINPMFKPVQKKGSYLDKYKQRPHKTANDKTAVLKTSSFSLSTKIKGTANTTSSPNITASSSTEGTTHITTGEITTTEISTTTKQLGKVVSYVLILVQKTDSFT